MADRSAARIRIGGRVPWNIFRDEASAYFDYALPARPTDLDDGKELGLFAITGGHLVIEVEEQTGGAFPEFETWLRENGIDYDRESDGHYEWPPQISMFRHGMIHAADFIYDGEPHIPVGKIWDAMRRGDAQGAYKILTENYAPVPDLKAVWFTDVPEPAKT